MNACLNMRRGYQRYSCHTCSGTDPGGRFGLCLLLMQTVQSVSYCHINALHSFFACVDSFLSPSDGESINFILISPPSTAVQAVIFLSSALVYVVPNDSMGRADHLIPLNF